MRNRWRDLLYGLRLLWKNPGFTSVAVLALAFRQGRFEMDPVSFGIFALQNAD